MCTPDLGIGEMALLASAGASAGGAIMQSNAAASNQAAAIKAKNDTMAQTLAQQAQQQKLATNVFDQTLSNFQGSEPQKNLQTMQAADTANIANNAPTAQQLAGGAITPNAPKVVQDAENQSIADRMKKIGDFGANLGALTGYDSANAGTARGLKQAAAQIGTYGNFANEDATVGNAATQAAIANSQKPASPWGDILSGVGDLGSYYAGKNGAFANLFGQTPKVLNMQPVNLTVPNPTGFY